MAGLLGAYGTVSWCCFLWLEQTWAHRAPTSPNQTLGLIYQHNDHGYYTYFSAFQVTTCALMFMTSVPLFMTAVLISPKKNVTTTLRWFGFRSVWQSDDPKALRWKAAAVGAVATPVFVFFGGPFLIQWLNSLGVVLNFG